MQSNDENKTISPEKSKELFRSTGEYQTFEYLQEIFGGYRLADKQDTLVISMEFHKK